MSPTSVRSQLLQPLAWIWLLGLLAATMAQSPPCGAVPKPHARTRS